VHRDVFAQVAFDVPSSSNHLRMRFNLVLAQVLDLLEGVNVRLVQNLARAWLPDAEA